LDYIFTHYYLINEWYNRRLYHYAALFILYNYLPYIYYLIQLFYILLLFIQLFYIYLLIYIFGSLIYIHLSINEWYAALFIQLFYILLLFIQLFYILLLFIQLFYIYLLIYIFGSLIYIHLSINEWYNLRLYHYAAKFISHY